MGFLNSKWFSRLGITLGVLLVLAGGYGLYSLYTERNALEKEVADLDNKVVLLKKKYAEQKSLAEAMLRAKQAAESRARHAESLQQENETLLASIEDMKKEAQAVEARHQEQMDEMKERVTRMRTAYDNLREESNRIILEKNQKITELTGERDALQVSLNQETIQHKRCRTNNGRLAELSTELVARYKDKGVLGSITESEPFTQLKKVEHEKLCQEYLDKIDRDTL